LFIIIIANSYNNIAE